MKKLSNLEIGILGAAAIVFFVAYQKGVFKKNKGFETSQGNATDGSSQTIDINTAKNISKGFRDALIGNSTSRDIFLSACDSLQRLNETDLIVVSNEYNKMYVNKDYNTLRSLLVQEWAVYGSSAEAKRKLLDKFTKVGI